jgi:hypothetical protein
MIAEIVKLFICQLCATTEHDLGIVRLFQYNLDDCRTIFCG